MISYLSGMNYRAFAATLVFFMLTLLCVIYFSDRPLSFSSVRHKKIAAIALRDNVSPLEKRGSALFTVPYLEKYYSDFNYLEAKNDWVTTREFKPYAEQLLKNADSLDVYILSHGNKFYEWFYSMDPEVTKKIRMVYNSGCENDSQCIEYKKFGIKYYVGHTGELSLSPVFYVYFLRRMFSESSVASAVEKSNLKTNFMLDFFISNRDTIKASEGNFHLLENEKITD
jgi:hypothetical protein